MNRSIALSHRRPFITKCLPLLALIILLAGSRRMPVRAVGNLNPQAAPVIHTIATNLGDYPGGQVPTYEKFEITFQVDTGAQNLQLPYDPAPPPGVQSGVGIRVDAQFTPDDWQTVYTQPAFYYQDFVDEVRSGREWYYPSGQFAWKVRFAPTRPGVWQYRLLAQDAGGSTQNAPASFTVVPSTNHGFVRVSPHDPRYFEFDDGTYFPGLGYNMNYDHVSWENPVLDNQAQFQRMAENGIQLVRIWLSQWSIYGSTWNPWNSIDPAQHGAYLPYTGLTYDQAAPGSELSMKVSASYNPCMFIGAWKAPPAVKRNTNYRVRIRYLLQDLQGPRLAGQPYGFVAKTGGWLWGNGNNCADPGVGTPVTPMQTQNTTGWQILEGSLNTGGRDFLPNFYLVMENASGGTAYVDYVWIEEDLGDGTYGPNIVSKPWMDHHRYMEQRNAYAFDKLLDLAEQYQIYLRPVVHEKNDWIFNHIDFEGNFSPDFDNNHFYGNWRQVTKVRWLQQAWWRMLQARWGYSTQIHSWELLNEGDPWNGLHYTLADEFGAFMHQFTPDDHLVSTSFWHSFPRDEFWANPAYPNVDFADYHRYVGENEAVFYDTCQATLDVSQAYGANQPGGAGKPVMRGETGFVVSGSGPPSNQLTADAQGVWLHNFVWGGINAGGLIESYWYENFHIYQQNPDGSYVFDHRPQYGAYYQFIKDVPMSNGNYEDLGATVSNPDVRVAGQKNLVSKQAHFWVQNKWHTWKNVMDGVPIEPVSATIQITGFQPGGSYGVQWWDPYQANVIQGVQVVTADESGVITLAIENLETDMAAKIVGAHQVYLPVVGR